MVIRKVGNNKDYLKKQLKARKHLSTKFKMVPHKEGTHFELSAEVGVRTKFVFFEHSLSVHSQIPAAASFLKEYTYDEETGLYYLNARMYDPHIGRFMQEDTYTGDPNDPLSLNLYT